MSRVRRTHHYLYRLDCLQEKVSKLIDIMSSVNVKVPSIGTGISCQRLAKTQISLGIHPVWSESSLSAWRNIGPLSTCWAHSEDSDQTGRMPRLIWVFTGCTYHFVGFVVLWHRYVCFRLAGLDKQCKPRLHCSRCSWRSSLILVCSVHHSTFSYYQILGQHNCRVQIFG